MTLALEWSRAGKNGTIHLAARAGETLLYSDKVDIGKASARERFATAVRGKAPTIPVGDIDRELLLICEQVTTKAPASSAAAPELDLSRIVRPELLHIEEVSGLAVPIATMTPEGPAGRWQLYLRWADGRREARALAPSIELPGGGALWLSPQPAQPDLATVAGWSAAGRRGWLAGDPAPDPASLFTRLRDTFLCFLELGASDEEADAQASLLASWTLLSYAYPAWSAVPYLSIGGPLGSGKSRVFEVLSRVAFRPMASANTTAPCLFRTLHDQGGTLLLDEAERLRDNTPDAGDLRSILLSGYKRGSPARRLEPIGDGKFRAISFDVFGPKALAGIASLPEALASRCIKVAMFRAAPDSEKPRRQLDADPSRWPDLRDGLHALALEHGLTWLHLAGQVDAAGEMNGRDAELWQPLLALAGWLESQGVAGLKSRMEDHAAAVIEATRDDALPDADEQLLSTLADQVRAGQYMTCKSLLELLRQSDANTFDPRWWSPQRVSRTLKRYGIETRKSAGQRVVDARLKDLERIQTAYGLDLGLLPF